MADTATEGSDFTAVMASGTITAGSTSTTITVDVTGDTTVETDEQFFVDLSNVNAGGLDVSLASITEMGFFDTPGDARSVQVIGSTAYVADRASGLRVLNVSNPASMTELGFFDTPSFAYSVQVIGSTAYVADSGSGLRVLDVSNPASITELGFFATPDSANSVQVIGSTAYVADGFSGLRVLDVSNPATITELSFFDTPDIAFSVQVIGSTAYVADGFSGLRVLDVNLNNRGTGTIQNDDSATLSISNVTMPEGNSGTTTFTFDVTLDAAVANDVTFDFATVADTATEGSDFFAANSSGSITAGSTSTTITVDVTGDTTVEADEHFFVGLSNLNAGGLSVQFPERLPQRKPRARFRMTIPPR
ncbi:MAG: Calx-beta domain-containing protein [Planctomycetaceae bacterium]